LRDGDEEVSRLWVLLKRMRVGRAYVRFGGIGGVWTHRDHRLKGHAARLMEGSTELMRDLRCEMGLLFGISDFYHRFGYAVVYAEPLMRVAVENLLECESAFLCRQMRRADAPEVLALHNRLDAGCTGTVVRPRTWCRFELSAGFGKPGRAILACDRRGRTAGYAAYRASDERFSVHEICARDPHACSALALALGRRALRARIESVGFHLPPGHPFAAFAVRLGCQWRISYPRNGGGMGRLIPSPLLEKLAPELSRRLQAARCRWEGAIELGTEFGAVTLVLKAGALEVSRSPSPRPARVYIPQSSLAQLVMGYRSAAEIASAPQTHMPRAILSVVDALFPKGEPYMWWADRF